MKCIVLFTIFAVAASVDYYKVKDDVDIDVLITKHEDLKAYIDCFLDKGPCTDIGKLYKDNIPETFKQTCARCDDNLKYQYYHFLEGMKKIFPESYDEFRRRYDPSNKEFDALMKELSKYSKRS